MRSLVVALALSATGCGLLLDPAPPRGVDASTRPRDAAVVDASSMDAAVGDAWVEPELDAWTPADATMDAANDGGLDAPYYRPDTPASDAAGPDSPDGFVPDAFRAPCIGGTDRTVTGGCADPGTYCEGSCGAPSTCAPIEPSCGMEFEPVCGCNGVTYANLCLAHLDGVEGLGGTGPLDPGRCFGDSDCDRGGSCLFARCERSMLVPGTCFTRAGCCLTDGECGPGQTCHRSSVSYGGISYDVGVCGPIGCVPRASTGTPTVCGEGCCLTGPTTIRVEC